MFNKVSWLIMAALLTFVVPGTAWGQEEEEEDPPVVRLSFFMCDLGGDAGDQIEQELENEVMPVWLEIAGEDMGIMDYGYIFHWWADEWNVGIYTIAESIQAIVDAEEEAGNRLEERFGDDPTAFGQACPHHRDGFYIMGPNVRAMMEEAGAAGGR